MPIYLQNLFSRSWTQISLKVRLKRWRAFFREEGKTKNKFLGVKHGKIFKLAKAFAAMPPKEIEALLKSEFYEARMGAVSILDFQARNKKLSDEDRKLLFEIYLKNHNRINNWDLVDRAAPWVIGGYLYNRPRKKLFELAKSKNVWERRTAIVSTYYFIRQGDIEDTFLIAEVLVNDPHDLMHKAVGSWLREAGKQDERKLIAFLDKQAKKMPREMLRYAIEKLDKGRKEFYMNLTK